ncbi:hypothetical protein BHM03_00028223 [Ensete ventricosum]|nr:hypothetical protein BHM03_00028223 [Ensete ventricosum]
MRSCRLGPEDVKLSFEDKADLKRVADQRLAFELPPHRYTMSMLELVIPLDRISLEVYSNDVNRGCI